MNFIKIVALFLAISLLSPLFAQADSNCKDIWAVWKCEKNKVEKQSSSKMSCTCHERDKSVFPDYLIIHVPFCLGIPATAKPPVGKTHSVELFSHDSVKIIAIENMRITKIEGMEKALIKQEIKDKALFTTLLEVCGSKDSIKIEGIVDIYYLPKTIAETEPNRTDARGGNCFKCGGTGKLGSWCTFCHYFVSWCIHGGSLRTCDGCGGIGWIETYYYRCPKCVGRGWCGGWCTFCHAFVIWCIHGGSFHTCSTCSGKGAIKSGSTCGKCGGQGWVGSYCCFCHANVMWCIHGHSPCTCSGCGGSGVVK